MRCPEMTVFDYSSWMCMPLAMEGMQMKMLMVNGNVYLSQTASSSSRGRSALYSTSMIMGDLGSSFGANHYLNLDLMLTAEKWLVPERGYPLPLQVGESDSSGVPYVDAQHPHSSPLMGITISDTITLGDSGDYLRLLFAPRGESTDGPVAFMHRPTGMANPDAPLGHHLGQDVGHISSTVFGVSWKKNEDRFEIAAFHGTEPKPEKVDLPLGAPNSISARWIREWSPSTASFLSVAYLHDPEATGEPDEFQGRISGSLYSSHGVSNGLLLQNALISGFVRKYDRTEWLSSFGEEFLLTRTRDRFWGRIELLERTPAELGIGSLQPDHPVWVAAFTAGVSRRVADLDEFGLFLGVSAGHDLLSASIRDAYGGNPWAGKVFLQLGGMKMTHLTSSD
jgi:hypothetical protein